MIHLGRSASIVGMLAALLSGTASAVPVFGEQLNPTPARTVYGPPLTVRTTFESNLIDLRRVDFEKLDVGTVSRPTQLSFVGAGGTTNADLLLSTYCLTGDSQRCGVNNNASVGRYNTTGATANAATEGKWWEADGGFTLIFTESITAFGFYGTDFGDLDGVLSIELFRETTGTQGNSFSVQNTTGSTAAGGLVFWGFEDAVGYKAIRFNISQTNTAVNRFDVFGFDDMVIGRRASAPPPDGVPEPATLALVGLSLGALAVTRRRRTAAQG